MSHQVSLSSDSSVQKLSNGHDQNVYMSDEISNLSSPPMPPQDFGSPVSSQETSSQIISNSVQVESNPEISFKNNLSYLKNGGGNQQLSLDEAQASNINNEEEIDERTKFKNLDSLDIRQSHDMEDFGGDEYDYNFEELNKDRIVYDDADESKDGEEYEEDEEKNEEDEDEEDDDSQMRQDTNVLSRALKTNSSEKSFQSSSESGSARRSLSIESIESRMERVGQSNWRNSSSAGYKYEKIARQMYSSKVLQVVEESDDLILATEEIILKLSQEDFESDADNNTYDNALFVVSDELIRLWGNYHKQTTVYRLEEYTATIGPGPQAPNFAKANFLASLTLKVLQSRQTSSLSIEKISLPQILLEWMEEHHNPYPNQYEEIFAQIPSPATHPHFWDTIFNCLIRGKVKTVINILKKTSWNHVRDEIAYPNSIAGQNRYSDYIVASVEQAMNIAVETLLICPAISGDWNSQNVNWRTFRLRALQALQDLNKLIEGGDYDSDEAFKVIDNTGSFNTTAKKAKSLIPWHLYQSLVTLYSLIIGDMNAILANSQDWCEAVVGLVAWWDESKKDQNLSLSCFQHPHSLPESDLTFEYFDRKLRISLEAATSDSTDFQINSADEVQIALASLFEADAESVIGFLSSWSGPISCAVAEIASLVGWLPQPVEKDLISMGNLDQEDFNLLGINHSPTKVDRVKDRALITYANNLCKRTEFRSSIQPEKVLNSWEISIAILGRLDSIERSTEIIGDLLNHFPLKNSETINKLLILLNSIELTNQAETVAQNYADDLAENSLKYGEALYYYALAHKPTKVRNVLDLLISNSLVLSSAYPFDEDLDDHLRSFITSPQLALTHIARLDIEAAQLLQKSLSGYATLRKFYDLRDGDLLKPTGMVKTSSKLRKSQAAIALMAVITSSGDQIRGGLYDRERDAVIHVEFLLALLGEAMVFIDKPDFILTVPQIETLLFAIEDLKSAPSKVYSACANFLRRVLTTSHALDNETSGSTGLLQKSDKSVNNSGFCIIRNSMFASQPKRPLREKRGWDWRESFSEETTGDDLLKLIRFSLAKDLAKAWLMEIDHEF